MPLHHPLQKLTLLFVTSPQEQPCLSSTPIQALPPASAIDLDVLDALPLHLKRELERAYGEAIQLMHTSLMVH